MGFTRYWIRPRELDAKAFAEFSLACRDACASLGVELVDAQFYPDRVTFNGVPGCEPFVIERISQGREREAVVSEFCKTQQLPYDVAVDACLRVLEKYFPQATVSGPP